MKKNDVNEFNRIMGLRKPEQQDTELEHLRKENKRLREKEAQRQKEDAQRESEAYCERHGHDWYRHRYVGIGGKNYLTCQRCGAEMTD